LDYGLHARLVEGLAPLDQLVNVQSLVEAFKIYLKWLQGK
jgi:hypothetical protein